MRNEAAASIALSLLVALVLTGCRGISRKEEPIYAWEEPVPAREEEREKVPPEWKAEVAIGEFDNNSPLKWAGAGRALREEVVAALSRQAEPHGRYVVREAVSPRTVFVVSGGIKSAELASRTSPDNLLDDRSSIVTVLEITLLARFDVRHVPKGVSEYVDSEASRVVRHVEIPIQLVRQDRVRVGSGRAEVPAAEVTEIVVEIAAKAAPEIDRMLQTALPVE